VGGALALLGEDENWEAFGNMTPAECAQLMRDMLIRWYDEPCATNDSVPTPYWDEDIDVEDSAPSATQTWYGTVSDPEAAPGSLTFIENAAIWTFTGFLAIATLEIGAAPAILFSTIAPRFVLATRRGDLGEIIRILIDGEEAATVDTSGAVVGDVIRTTIVGDPSLTSHDVMIVQVS